MPVKDDELYIELGVVRTETLIKEMYGSISEWHDEALEINPDLKEEDWCQEFEAALESAEQAMEDAGIEVPD